MARAADTYGKLKEIHGIISREKFYEAVNEIIGAYNTVPYHSAIHGCDVMMSGYSFLSATKSENLKSMTPLEHLTFIFALLGHDVGHPGLANHNKLSRIRALFPRSRSPVEEFHYIQTRNILLKLEVPFIADLLHAIIITTDPTLPIADVMPSFPEHLRELAPIIKIADVNHAVCFFAKHLEWTWKLESELQIKLTPIAQLRFIEALIVPIVCQLESILTEDVISQMRLNLRHNMEHWQHKMEQQGKPVVGC